MSDNRRLSILKPPKPRTPLVDVDVKRSSGEQSRRVSFANVHLKKEFTADPEKNTIWHNSYEEEVNATPNNISIDSELTAHNQTNLQISELEFTEVVAVCFEQNRQQLIFPSEMELTETIPAVLNSELEITEALPGNINALSEQLNPEDMELTYVVSADMKGNENIPPRYVAFGNVSSGNESFDDSAMEFTRTVQNQNENLQDSNSEFVEISQACSKIYSDESRNITNLSNESPIEFSFDSNNSESINESTDIISPPLEIDWSFNVEKELAKLPPPNLELDEHARDLRKLVEDIEAKKVFRKKAKLVNLATNDKLLQNYKNFKIETNFTEIEQKIANIYKLLEESEKYRQQTKEKLEERKKVPTLTDKILELKNKDTFWDLIPNTKYSFTLFKNYKFDVKMEADTEIVENVEFSVTDEPKFSPIGRYCYQLNKPKLSGDEIKKLFGEKYTIFNLLDYVSKIASEILTISEEWEHLTYNCNMRLDENLNAKLVFTHINLKVVMKVTFNLNDLDNMTSNTICITNEVVPVDENAIKRIMKCCPPGFAFIRKFYNSVKEYLQMLHKSQEKNS